MPSERMMQAIGQLERAITRLERVADAGPQTPSSTIAARDALEKLDALIVELKAGGRRG
ncbi:hypothetical protein PX699_14410 [Sphingobium sp. H39-3-25]|uniref:hypothetical protein n=1 Tax=Sphingobium arseniciresistens TaxID=3030834 RepID=UPI0023B9FB4C|nr:hypothetical protein [Sphingobium arseniciresistens]